jgi:hypothetical protein
VSVRNGVLNIFFAILVTIIAAIFIPTATHALSVASLYSVRFHGIQYSGKSITYDGRYPSANDVGPEFGRVTCDSDDLYSRPILGQGPSKESSEAMNRCTEQEGGASGVPSYTPFYTLRGYRPDYCLAGRIGERWIIFYAENSRAKVGADILDLEKKLGRITLIAISSIKTRTQLSSKNLHDASQIEKITRMFLAAPMMKQSVNTAGALRYRYWITLWFKDGAAQTWVYFPDTGWLTPGLQMSQEFRRLVEQQLPPN